MPRFRSRIDGFNRAKRVWVCNQCQAPFTVEKPSSCTCCGARGDFTYLASKAEFKRYQELRALEAMGEIELISCHPRYPIDIKGYKIRVELDFAYKTKDGELVVEDVKNAGSNTQLSRLKRALVEERYGIKVTLVDS